MHAVTISNGHHITPNLGSSDTTPPPLSASPSVRPFGSALLSAAKLDTPKVRILIGESLGEHAQPTLDKLPAQEGILVSTPLSTNPAEMQKLALEHMKGKETDLLVVRGNIKVNKEFIESLAPADRPKFVLRAGTGMNNIDTDYLKSQHIGYTNTPDVNTSATAEHTLALLLSAARKIPQADQGIKQGEWDREHFTGIELKGKTLGIVGIGGRIGGLVAERAQAFGMTVIGLRPRNASSTQTPPPAISHYVDTLPDLMAQSNVVSVHVPLTPQTKNMIGKKEIEAMPKKGIILNVSRENVVNEEAILNALESKHLYAAGIDTFKEEKKNGVSHKLATHPMVVAPPHIGGQTEEACQAMGEAVLNQAKKMYAEKVIASLDLSKPAH